MLPEDRFTNSIADAAAYERRRAREAGELDRDVDYDRPTRSRARCHCKSASHGPDCPMLDFDPSEDEEPPRPRIEARSVTIRDEWGVSRVVGGFGDVGAPKTPPPSLPPVDEDDIPF